MDCRPSLDHLSGQVLFRFQPGPLAVAAGQQAVILFDEVNLAPADVLEVLSGFLSIAPEDDFELRNQSLRRGGAMFIAAMNEAAVGGGRPELPVSLRNQLTRVSLPPLEPDEIRRIAYATCGAAFAQSLPGLVGKPARAAGPATSTTGTQPCREGDPGETSASWLLDVALELNALLPSDVPGIDTAFNLRTLENAAAILQAVDWAELGSPAQRRYLQLSVLMLVYTAGCSPQFTAAAEAAVLRRFLDHGHAGGWHRTAGAGAAEELHQNQLAQWRRRHVPVNLDRGAVQFGPVSGSLADGATWSLRRLARCDDWWGEGAPAPQRGARHRRRLELLSLASESRRVVLLEGPTCAGKTSYVRDLAWLRNARLLTVAINAETEVADLVGGFAPTSDGPGEEVLAALNMALNAAVQSAGFEQVLARMLAHVAGDGTSSPGACNDDRIALGILQCLQQQLQPPQQCEELDALLAKLLTAQEHASRTGGASRLPFRVFAGPLVVAMKQGYWLLLDCVNAARPEVLERINSIGEADASLHLFELGEGKVKPHAAFRCFATAGTRRGSTFPLSDAFRNRCVVMRCEALDAGLRSKPSAQQPAEVARREAFEALELLAQSCGCSPRLAHELVKLHEMALAQAAVTPKKGRVFTRPIFSLARISSIHATRPITLPATPDLPLG